jgi:hypothetical protein
MGYDGSIRIDTRIDSKGFNAGIKGMTNALGKMAAAVGVAFGIGAIYRFVRSTVDAASDLGNAMLGLQSILESQGKSFADAQKFINEYISDGLMPATDAITSYKNLAAAGFNDTQIEQMLIRLKDAAAFGRQGSLSLGAAVRSATEGIKNENSVLVDNAGVTKNLSKMLKEYASSLGTTVNSLNDAQRIEAVYQGILRETQHQMGNAAALAGTYSGKLSNLKNSFYELKVALGNAIIPILNQIIPYVQVVVNWLTRLFTLFAKVVHAFFGKDISATMENSTASTQAAANAQGNLADETQKAGKAAKGALAAFDDLNVLQQDQSGDENAPISVGDVETSSGGFADLFDKEFEEIEKKVEAFKQAMIEYLTPATEAFGRLKDKVLELGGTVWEGLQWAWENILKPLGEWAVTDALPVFLDLLAVGADLLNSALLALQPMWQWFWENVLQPAAEWTGQALLDALEWLTEKLYALSDWINEHQTAFQNIILYLGIWAVGILVFVGVLYLLSAATAAVSAAVGAFGAVLAFISANPIVLIVAAIIGLIALIILLVKNWDWVKETAGKVWDWIKQKWSEAGPWFKENVTDPVKESFRTFLDWIKEKWETIFGGVKDFTKNTVNSIIDFINGMIRAVADGINAVINGLNAVKVTIPSWVPIWGGNVWSMDIPTVTAPQIPRLARGAVIPPNAEFLAVLGDQRNGRNLEAPEGLIRQIIQEEIANIQADVTVNFAGSLAALVRELKPYIDKENVRIGKSLITSGATS